MKNNTIFLFRKYMIFSCPESIGLTFFDYSKKQINNIKNKFFLYTVRRILKRIE
jgi:hypothetical protein